MTQKILSGPIETLMKRADRTQPPGKREEDAGQTDPAGHQGCRLEGRPEDGCNGPRPRQPMQNLPSVPLSLSAEIGFNVQGDVQDLADHEISSPEIVVPGYAELFPVKLSNSGKSH